MTFLMSLTPSGPTRFVFPSGAPFSTMEAACTVPHSIHPFMPAASRALRFSSSSWLHFDRSSAASLPT
ncbi:MAG: hypothetical protein WKG00_20495 [Polyangiaceae bacterium]